MEKKTQQVLEDITEVGYITGTKVIMDYVNRQDGNCDNKHMTSVAGRIEKITKEGVLVSGTHVPYGGPLAAICSIKRVGNNSPVYNNPLAKEKYAKENFSMLSNEQMNLVEQNGKWVY